MLWSRFAVDRIDADGSQAPVQAWLFQEPSGPTTAACVCPVALVPASATPEVPPRIHHLLRKRQVRGSLCALHPPDRAPFTFFASRCPRKGNGAVDVLDFAYDPDQPLVIWLRWRLSARFELTLHPVHLHYQEPRTIQLGERAQRHYPGDGGWQRLPAPVWQRQEAVRSSLGHYVHGWYALPAVERVVAPADLPEPSNGVPPYRSRLRDLPVEAITERFRATQAERPRSVLTFDKRPKPW